MWRSSPEDAPQARRVLVELGLVAPEPATPVTVDRAETSTNLVLRVRAGASSWVVRFGDPHAHGVDRRAELANQQRAFAAGLAPEIRGADPARCLLITRYVEGRPFPTGASVEEPELAAVARALARLHGTEGFNGAFDPVSTIDAYDAKLRARGRSGPHVAELDALHAQRARLVRGLGAEPALQKTAAHGDLTPSNVLLGPTGVIFVDWEYASVADPRWDLAYLTVESELPVESERLLVERYAAARGDAFPRVLELGAWKAAADLVSGLWMLLGGRADDAPKARARLARGLERLR